MFLKVFSSCTFFDTKSAGSGIMFLKTLLKIYIYTSPFNITHSVTTLSVSNYRSVFIRLQQDFTIACCEFNFADMRDFYV